MKKQTKRKMNRVLALVLCTAMILGMALQFDFMQAKAASEVKITQWNLTVSEGAIGLNLYFSGISDSTVGSLTVKVDGQSHTFGTKQADGAYVVSHRVKVSEVSKQLSVELYKGSTKVNLANSTAVNGVVTCSVEAYLNQIKDRDDEYGVLATSLLNYATCANCCVNNQEIPISLANVDLTQYKPELSGEFPSCVKYAGSSIVLTDTFAIRHYFDFSEVVTDGEMYVDGVPAGFELVDEALGRICVEISDIRAWDVDRVYVFRAKARGKEITLKYSVLSYAYTVLKNGKSDSLTKLVTSIYWYKEGFQECLEATSGGGQGEDPGEVTTTTLDYMNSKFTLDMPKAVIVQPNSPTEEEKYSAKLLQKYIEAEDGYKPSIISDSVAKGSQGFEISVGNTNRPHGTAAYSSNDSYSIKSYDGGISITGVGQLGLMHGAMRFLEAFGGYYYLSWDDLYMTNQKHFKYETSGISIDYERPFVFTDMDICFSSINPTGDLTDPYYGKGKPSGYEPPRTGRLFSLAFGLNGFYADSYCLPKSEAGRETWYLTAYKSSQYGAETPIEYLAAGQAHTLTAEFMLAKDYYDKHPEWFAAYAWYEDGELKKPDSERKRTKEQLCPYMLLHDPEAYAIIYQHCLDEIAKTYDPNAPIQIISVSKNDGDKLCMCSYCMKDRIAHGDSGGMYESIEYVQLLNQLSKDLHKDGAYPNLYLDMLAYEWTVEAPGDIICDDHVIVRWAPIRRCYGDYLNASGHITNTKYYNELVKWTKCCKHVWIWDYNSNFKTTTGPYANIDVMAHDIKLYKELGVEGVYLQSNSRHLESNSEFGDIRNYIEGRMLQDPSRDYEQELAFITDALYGKAGVYVREYMKRMEKQAKSHHTNASHRDDVYMYDRNLYDVYAGVHAWNGKKVIDGRMPDEEIGYCEGLWNEIKKIAAGESADVQKRINRLELGWRLVKSTLNVYEFGDPSTYKAQNELLIKDMKAAGVTFFSAISAKTIDGCTLPQNHPDNWYPTLNDDGSLNTSDRTIGTFTSTNPGTTAKPAIPENLFYYYKQP
ncbi:MAG: DUF4838 domain-containing protein [Lachnospiraceae bacterium]|nr:DUF4838 domain-containing protein [Lachnospiraceae bacterium]